MTRTLVLLVLASQLADLATLGLAQGHGTEIGPLAPLLASGGYGAVALAKVAGVAAMLGLLGLYQRRTRDRRNGPATARRLALLVATMGVFGAASGLAAIL